MYWQFVDVSLVDGISVYKALCSEALLASYTPNGTSSVSHEDFNMYEVKTDMHKSASPLGLDSRALFISNSFSSGNFSILHSQQTYSIQ